MSGKKFSPVKIIFRYKNKNYYIFQVKESFDGSFNIFFQKIYKEARDLQNNETIKFERPKKRQITYHTTGRINYKSDSNRPIFCEPTYNITQEFFFYQYSVPSLEGFPLITDSRPEYFAINVNEEIVTKGLAIMIGIQPSSYEGKRENSLIVDYSPYFKFEFLGLPRLLPNVLDPKLSYGVSPSKGLFFDIVVDEITAKSNYHRKGTNGPIIYPPNNQGVIRLVTKTPMALNPKLSVSFLYTDYRYELVKSERNEVQFIVKNKSGIVKDGKYLYIKEITLDSRI